MTTETRRDEVERIIREGFAENTALTLDAEELDTILAIGRNQQSGRVTNYELKELVRVYALALKAEAVKP